MKVAIITDTHLGCRKDNIHFMENQFRFYEEQFIPFLTDNKIKTIIHMGDVFCRRQQSNHFVLHQHKTRLFDVLRDMNVKIHVIPGNHDLYYDGNSSVNSLSLMLSEYKNITIYNTPTTIKLGKSTFTMMPWINKDNYDLSINVLNTPDSKVLMGHLDIQGVLLNDSEKNNEQRMAQSLFKNYETVLSGHFHEQFTAGNINYVGSAFEYTWQDLDKDRGFSVWDTNDTLCKNMEFIKNEHKMFFSLEYGDKIDYDTLNGKVVRLSVNSEYIASELESYIEDLESTGLYRLEVIDNTQYHILANDIDLGKDTSDDPIELFAKQYIDRTETSLDGDQLMNKFMVYYKEAVSND